MTAPPVGEPAPRRSSAAAVVVATIAVVAALYAGHEVLVPLCLALVLTALLTPAVAWLARHRVPTPAAAALMVILSLAVLVGATGALVAPVRGLASALPKSVAAAKSRLSRMQSSLSVGGPAASSTAGREAVAPAGGGGGADSGRSASTPSGAPSGAQWSGGQPSGGQPAGGQSAGNQSSGSRPAGGQSQGGHSQGGQPAGSPSSDSPSSDSPSSGSQSSGGSSSGGSASGAIAAVERTLGVTASLLSELVEVLLLSLFLLAGGHAWVEKLALAVPDDARRHATLRAALEIRAAVARYLLATALINVGQGVLVGLAVWALGVKAPLLWGALTFLLEFVPYLGGFVVIALLLVAGLSSGGSAAHAVLAPIAYLAITTLQNNLVSPLVYGRGLRLNPAAILVAVMLLYALWGVAGAFLAVPILAAVRVLTKHVPGIAPVGPFIGE